MNVSGYLATYLKRFFLSYSRYRISYLVILRKIKKIFNKYLNQKSVYSDPPVVIRACQKRTLFYSVMLSS